MSVMECRATNRDNTNEGADCTTDIVVRPRPEDVAGASEVLTRIDALLGTERRGQLVGPDGDSVELPASVLEGLRRVAAAIAAGQAVMVAPRDMMLTTQQAAEILHVSRPHLIKLLDQGDLPYTRTSNDPAAHRRVLLRDVMSYREQRRKTRRQLLRELTQESEDAAGGYS